MKSGKRFFSALLALVMVLGMAAPAYAEGEATVTEFYIEPVVMVERADVVEVSQEDGTSDEFYDIGIKNPLVNVLYSDGRAITLYMEEFEHYTDLVLSYPDGLPSADAWTASEEPYAVKMDLVDPYTDTVLATTEVSVLLQPNPVESFSVETITLTEGVHTSLLTDEEGNEVKVYDFLNYTNPAVTVTFNDGREPLDVSWWDLDHILGYSPRLVDDLLDTADWEPGEHTLRASFMGVACEISIIIEENPVVSAITKPVTAIQDWHTITEEYYDEEKNEYATATFVPIWDLDYVFVVTLKDGTTVEYGRDDLWEADLVLDYEYEDYLKTKDWVAGNTYTVPLTLNGASCPAEVSFVANPAASIEGVPLTFFTSEGHINHGWNEETGEEISYLWYPVDSELAIKVNYTDGTTATLMVDDLWGGSYGRVDVNYQQYQEATTPWLPGNTYKITVRAMGHETEIPVTIVDDSVVEISAKAQYSLYETLSGQGDLDYTQPLVTLKKANGVTVEVPLNKIYSHISQDAMVSLDLETPLEEGERLAAGTYNAVLRVGDISCTFPITVEKNPIKTFKVTTAYPFTDGLHGWDSVDNDGNEFFQYGYEFVPFTIELTLNDGTVETYSSTEDDLRAMAKKYRSGDVYPWMDQAHDDIHGPGTYTLDVYLMNMMQPHTVKVISSDIKSVTGAYKGRLIEDVDGWMDVSVDANGNYVEYFHYMLAFQDLVFTITMNDGTVQTLGLEDLFMGVQLGNYLYAKDLQSAATPWKVGKNKLPVSLLGFDFEVEVEVIENAYEKLTISGDNGLTLKLEKTDGTVDTYVAYDFTAEYVEKTYAAGYLHTDKGTLTVYLVFTDETMKSLLGISCLGLESNKLDDCQWLVNEMVTSSVGSAPDVVLGQSFHELKDLVSDGDDNIDRAWLEIRDITSAVTGQQETLLKDALAKLEGYDMDSVLDLTLYAFNRDTGSEEITKTPKPLEISIALPEELVDLGSLLVDVDVLRNHEGKVDVLDGTVENGYVTIQTDRFSTYALVYSAHSLTKVEGKDATTTAEGVKEHYKCSHCDKLFADAEAKTEVSAADVVIGKLPDPSNPQTGDTTPIAMLMVLAIASGLLLAGTAAFGKKRSW